MHGATVVIFQAISLEMWYSGVTAALDAVAVMSWTAAFLQDKLRHVALASPRTHSPQ